MNKEDFQRAVAAHFQKFGFTKRIMDTIQTTLMPEDLEDVTAEQVTEICQAYEPLAKAFQSETDARVQTAIEKAKKGNQSDRSDQNNRSDQDEDEDNGDQTEDRYQALMQRLERLEKEKTMEQTRSTVAKALEALKMTPAEVRSAMLGRSFESEDEALNFIDQQSEIYEEITKERAEHNAGEGFSPGQADGGSYSKKQIEADVEEFNRTNKIQK